MGYDFITDIKDKLKEKEDQYRQIIDYNEGIFNNGRLNDNQVIAYYNTLRNLRRLENINKQMEFLIPNENCLGGSEGEIGVLNYEQIP